MAREWNSTQVEIDETEDLIEVCYENGWTDGLPVVPPTSDRVERMLSGTDRDPDELIAAVPPKWGRATVEKVAINAVMAGCKPAYLPLILAAVKAMTSEQFNLHGVQVTTSHVGPMLIVNGPIRKVLEINGGFNLFGQGGEQTQLLVVRSDSYARILAVRYPVSSIAQRLDTPESIPAASLKRRRQALGMPCILTVDSKPTIALSQFSPLPDHNPLMITGAIPLKVSSTRSLRISLPPATAAVKRFSSLVLNTQKQFLRMALAKPTFVDISLTQHNNTQQKTYCSW